MWPNSQETEDLVTFTEEFFNGKVHFLCSDAYGIKMNISDSLLTKNLGRQETPAWSSLSTQIFG